MSTMRKRRHVGQELRQRVNGPAEQKAVNVCNVGTMTSELVEQLAYEMSPL